MSIKEAMRITSKEGKPLYAIEGTNYFIFTLGDKNTGEMIANNCSYVVDKRNGTGKWTPASAFPLKDGGDFIREYESL